MVVNNQIEIEQIELRQRMNDYPSELARVANIIENRPESRLYFSSEKAFFDLFNTNLWSTAVFLMLIVSLLYGVFKRDKE